MEPHLEKSTRRRVQALQLCRTDTKIQRKALTKYTNSKLALNLLEH
jgi:hypothetical protein